MRSKDDGMRLGEDCDFRVANRSVCGVDAAGKQRTGQRSPCEENWKWLHHLDLGRRRSSLLSCRRSKLK